MSSLTLSNSAFVPGRCPALSTNVNSCILSFNPGSAWPVVPACCVSPWFEALGRGPDRIPARGWVSGHSFGPSPGSRILSGLPLLGPASFHDASWRLAHPAFHASRRKTFAPVVPDRSSRKGHLARLVGTDRFELSTSRLSVVRSNQLSYAPALVARNLALRLNGRDSLGGGLNCLQQTHPLFFLRKEVIQPQIPLRLPCYDFTPVADLTVVGCLLCRLAHRLQVKPTPMV